MTAPTGTYQTYAAVGNREDLTDDIYNISPTDVPFMSAIGRTKAKAVKHEWQTDSLASATTDNAQIEGDDVTGSTSAATSRIDNYCQISRKDIVVSGTQDVVSKAGRASEVSYLGAKRVKELKRDMETILTQNQGYVVGAATVARKLRSLESWLATNQNRNTVTTTVAGATAGATTAGKPATAATLGATDASATRAITEAYLKDVVQKCFSSGAEPKIVMCGPVHKQQISGFTGRTSARQNIASDKIQAAAHLYASDFGELRIVPNRFQRERSIFVLDPEYAAVAYLRPFKKKDLAVTGDSMKKFWVVEYTLEMKNEAAHGIIGDLNTTY